MKFLIVDDSYDDRLVTRRYLNREFGHDVEIHQARDPREALDVLDSERFVVADRRRHHRSGPGGGRDYGDAALRYPPDRGDPGKLVTDKPMTDL